MDSEESGFEHGSGHEQNEFISVHFNQFSFAGYANKIDEL